MKLVYVCLYMVSIQACLCNPTIRGVGIEYDHDIYLRACDLVNANNAADRVRINTLV